MANNRIWLVHRPTGFAVMLGKRMGYGWYLQEEPNQGKRMSDFFKRIEEAEYEGSQDDFVLAIEDGREAPDCTENWKYADREPFRIELSNY